MLTDGFHKLNVSFHWWSSNVFSILNIVNYRNREHSPKIGLWLRLGLIEFMGNAYKTLKSGAILSAKTLVHT